MFPNRRMKRRLTLVTLFAAAVAGLAAVATPTAFAAGEVGRSAPASVTCDSITHGMYIQPHIAIGAAYDRQRLGFKLYIQRWDPYYRQWLKVDPWAYDTNGYLWAVNGQQLNTFTHDRWTTYYDANLFRPMRTSSEWAEPYSPTITFKAGYYAVYIQYAWEVGMNSNVWWDKSGSTLGTYSPWDLTTGYNWPGLAGTFQWCIL